jgi:phenylalanyl-tRNA synthetase beta chain
MIFSYNWLQSFFKKPLPKPDKLVEILTMHSFEVEEVKKVGKDYILDIDVLPNRAHDCLCHSGIAREIAAITGYKLQPLKREKLKEIKGRISPIKLKIQCPSLVPRYSAIAVEGIKVSKSPRWLKERLEVVGIRLINNIVDLTNFVMLETGQPLHAFDYDKIRGKKMILRQSRKGEKVITLDGVKRELGSGVLVIEDEERLIDLVGIMGGKLSEVGPKTKNIILQAGNFDRRAIYLATRALDHSTEASNIYTQGIDPNLTIPTLERTYLLLKEFGGGRISQIIDVYPKKFLAKKVKLDLVYMTKLLGVKIEIKEVKNILNKLEFKIIQYKHPYLTIEVPIFRLDISLPEDLIEEIGRIFGYGKVPATFPVASLIPPKRNFEIFWEDTTKNILKEAGFSEVYNYSFISLEQVSIFKFQPSSLIEVENPVSTEQKCLRPSLIPNLLNNVKNNFKYFDSIRIFELGKIFSKKQKAKNEKQIEEKRMLSGVVAGKQKPNLFSQVKGTMDLLLNGLGISNIWYDEFQPTPEESKITTWHPKKCAEIKVDSEEIGFLGEISPKILKNLKINGDVVLFDLDFEKLTKLCSEEHEYQPISQYPAAVRDLAILVPREAKVVEVLNKINTAGGPLIRDIDLFDIYEGEEIPAGKKNLAFHIIYQAEDKTLKTEEIDKIQEKIIKALEKEPGWEVRK